MAAMSVEPLTKNESDILKVATELLESGRYCDAILKTEDGGEFKVHRGILSVSSPYFRALFKPSFGGERREFTIPGISASVMGLLVKFAYTGVTEVTEENVIHLLPAADQFCVTGAIRDCTAFLLERMTPDNCIGFLGFASIYFLFELEKEAKRCLLSNFVVVSESSEEYLEMSLTEVVALLSSDRLHVKGEEQVWEAGLRWIEHDAPERRPHMAAILKCVRLGLLDTSFFMDKVKQHPYIENNETCRPTVIETLRFLWDLQIIGQRMEVIETPLLATPRIPHSILFTVGGWSGGSPTDLVETYDTKADRWIQVPEKDPAGPRAYHKLGVIGFDVYVIGGFNGNEYFRSCRCFNAATKQWKDVAPMNCKRCYVSAATLNDYIYAMGGFDGDHRQNSVERYDPRMNQWTAIAPMNAQRSDASATTLEGRIYIVGGFNGAECLNTAECYDPVIEQWSTIAPMRQKRSGVSVISHHGHIYALGGFNGISRLQNGERYDPASDQWTAIPDMFNPRSNFAIEVMDDMIFAMGGFNGVSTIFHVECFDDKEEGEWYEATDMNAFRSALAACVVHGLPEVEAYVHPNRRGLMEEKRQKLLQQQRIAEARLRRTDGATNDVAGTDV